MLRRLAATCVFLLPAAAGAQGFPFTVAQLMRGPEFYGREPGAVRWSPDGRSLYFTWLTPGSDWRAQPRTFRVATLPGARPEALSDAAADSIGPLIAAGALSPDGLRRVTEYRGDLYVVDLRRSTVAPLTATLAQESTPRWSADGQRVLFVRDNNAFSIDLGSRLERQLSDIRAGGAAAPAGAVAAGGGGGAGGAPLRRDSAATPRDPQRAAMARDQRMLLDAVRTQLLADSLRESERTRRMVLLPEAVTLRPEERVQQVQVSPSGAAALLLVSTAARDARQGIVPNYVTASGYTEDIPNRTKVGDAQAMPRLGLLSMPRGGVRWLPLLGDGAPLASANLWAWNDAGTQALVAATSRNFKQRIISVVDAATGALQTIETLTDTAWVGGPCSNGCAGFYDGGRRVYWVSEAETGYAQLWSAAVDGSDRRRLTTGAFEIYDIRLSADTRTFQFHSSETSAFDRELWSMPTAGGARTRLTPAGGGHQAVLSPDEQWMADVYSRTNRPPELFLVKRGAATMPTPVTTSPTPEFLAYAWRDPEIVMLPASDGAKVPAHIYRPADFGAQPNGAAVIFVHGAGYMHNIHHYWKSSYPREYMFNHLLAARGYVVLDIDYRASAGYGRDWRTAIYRFMGGRDLQDQVDGSKYLTSTFGVPAERIGMYGGSYGGFMTLMALFTEPKRFGAGAALRSVTDWAHYNNQYTGQILNLPQDDTLAYHRSSPIFHAEGLEDPLLMLHGMVDQNVNFQDIVRLNQRLIELGKTDWDLAVFPVEDHSFTAPASWTDEYRRILDFFTRTIGPAGSKAAR